MSRVLLISMPFAALDTPSLALGLFKSRLNREGIPCDVQYLNFGLAEMIGWDDYEYVLRLPAILAGEQVFAASLFGEWLAPVAEYYQEVVNSGNDQAIPARLEHIRTQVPAYLQHCLESVPWQAYDIIGFTSLFEQNLASLALAWLVKQRYPNKVIVFGGANCEEIMGLTLHRSVPFIDFVCSGEADESFPELVKRLAYQHPVDGLAGVVSRRNGQSVYPRPARMIEDLEALPYPDYDDYFERLHRSPLAPNINPSLLMESARGCWWGEKMHCTFCGLNGLTMKFRSKSAARTMDEMEYLIGRYGVRLLRLTDNILEPGYFKDLLPEIAHRRLGANVICEVKANLKKDQIKVLADAGATVQAGIESLSTHVLDLMDKGSNSLMNIQTLKWSKQYGMLADWNLLYGFPGESPEDYQRSVELAEILTHLDPPSGCGPIRLDRFSPNYNHAEAKGFTNVRPLRFFRHIYPFDKATLSDLVYYFDFDYKEPIDDGGHVPALEQAIAQWKDRRDELYCAMLDPQVVIRDSRPVAIWPETIVSGLAARVYEYCDKIRSFRRIVETMQELGDVTEQEVAEVLEEFIRRKLMVRENDRYLSLAVMTYVSDFERLENDRRLERTAEQPAPAAPELAVMA